MKIDSVLYCLSLFMVKSICEISSTVFKHIKTAKKVYKIINKKNEVCCDRAGSVSVCVSFH